MPEAVMLFAAGFGTRMRHLTQNRPKPLVHVAGRALLDHALDVIHDHGPLRCVVNAHYRADMIEAHLAQSGVIVTREEPEILDTGGGLSAALPLLAADPVFTMNSDALWQGPNPLDVLAAAWKPQHMDALLLCIPPSNALGHKGQGDFLIDTDGCLTRGPGLVYSGMQILKADVLGEISDPVFSLNRAWDILAGRGRIFGVQYDGTWCDVGSPEGVARGEKMLKDGHV